MQRVQTKSVNAMNANEICLSKHSVQWNIFFINNSLGIRIRSSRLRSFPRVRRNSLTKRCGVSSKIRGGEGGGREKRNTATGENVEHREKLMERTRGRDLTRHFNFARVIVRKTKRGKRGNFCDNVSTSFQTFRLPYFSRSTVPKKERKKERTFQTTYVSFDLEISKRRSRQKISTIGEGILIGSLLGETRQI